MKTTPIARCAAPFLAVLLASCQAPSVPGMGALGTMVSGGQAASDTDKDKDSLIQTCTSPYGSVVLVDDTSAGARGFSPAGGPTAAMRLRALIQRSNCFVVLEQDKQSTAGRGPDFRMKSALTLRTDDTRSSGVGDALGSLLDSRYSSALRAAAGTVQNTQASAQMSVVDARTGAEIAFAEGQSKKVNVEALSSLLATGSDGLSGYAGTPEGKVVMAAAVDAYNKIVIRLRTTQKPRVL